MSVEGLFQSGTTFPSIAGAAICLKGEEVIHDLQIKELKDKIIDFLETHEKVKISTLAEEFDVSPKLISQAINELEEECLIRNVE